MYTKIIVLFACLLLVACSTSQSKSDILGSDWKVIDSQTYEENGKIIQGSVIAKSRDVSFVYMDMGFATDALAKADFTDQVNSFGTSADKREMLANGCFSVTSSADSSLLFSISCLKNAHIINVYSLDHFKPKTQETLVAFLDDKLSKLN